METTRSADGTTLAFDRTGQGPTLVIVGGAFGDRATPRLVADALAPDFTVVCYDRRGRGGSGDTPPYAVLREVEDLEAVIAATGGTAFVYGHSSGAILSLEAATRSEAIARLVAYEPPYVVGDDRARTVDLGDRVAALLEAGRRDEAMETFFLEGPQAPADAVAALKLTPGWQAMAELAHTLPYDLALAGDQVIPVDRLATIRIPTLVLSGADSPSWARNAVVAVAAAIPGARHASLAGQTHAASPDALVPVLREAFGD